MNEIKHRLIGYCRASTKKQMESIKIQRENLEKCKCDKIFQEIISGAKINDKYEYDRPELNKCLSFLKKDDILIVNSMCRVGRLMFPTLKLFYEQLLTRGVFLKTYRGDIIDPNNPQSIQRFYFEIMMVENEYMTIVSRMRIGLANANKKGFFGGRPHSYDASKIQRAHYLNNKGLKIKDIIKDLQVTRRTYYRMLKHNADSFVPRIKKK